jgi:hypothetical protein
LIDAGSHINTSFDFLPSNTRFVVITNNYLAEDITQEQKKKIDQLLVLPKIDLDSVLSAVKNNTKDYASARLISIDESISPMVAQVREILGIPGPTIKEIIPFCDKFESKNRLKGSSINYPNFIEFNHNAYQKDPKQYLIDVQKYLKFPLIVKPKNLSGSHGIRRLNTLKDLEQWCSRYIPEDYEKEYGLQVGFEIEEFVEIDDFTDFFHCDSIIKDGKALLVQVCQYTHPQLEVINGKPTGSIMLPTTDKRYKVLSKIPGEVIRAFSRHASIPDGVMHMEVFYNQKTEKITFIETQLRHPGLDTCVMYKLCLNMDWEDINWKLQMGLPIESDIKKSKIGPYTMWIYFPTKNGVIDSLEFPNIKSKLHKIQYRIQTGQKTTLPKALTLCNHCNKIALRLLISNKDFKALWSDFEYLKRFQPFNLCEDIKQ